MKKNVVKDVVLKELNFAKILEERIYINKNLFTKNELTNINKNASIYKKIYLIGLSDGREIYGKNLQ